jgi:hypothetical protein
MSPTREAQVRAARLGISGREQADQADKKAKDLKRKQSVKLTEAERRRIWHGCRAKSPLGELASTRAVNLAKIGREWLEQIGQLPDFSLILDSHGNVIGRYEVEPEQVPLPDQSDP